MLLRLFSLEIAAFLLDFWHGRARGLPRYSVEPTMRRRTPHATDWDATGLAHGTTMRTRVPLGAFREIDSAPPARRAL